MRLPELVCEVIAITPQASHSIIRSFGADALGAALGMLPAALTCATARASSPMRFHARRVVSVSALWHAAGLVTLPGAP